MTIGAVWKMQITFAYKGVSATASLEAVENTDSLFSAVERSFELEGQQNLKILYKGKQISPGMALSASALAGVTSAKVMVMATGAKEVAAVREARADPTIRGFASEEAKHAHHLAQQRGQEELSEWRRPQHPKFRFCRFEPCTWQSFGTRPGSSTPHAFEARALLLKLAQDPAIVAIMKAREYTVGLLAELDPIDDRHAEKMEGEGKRLLGYNMNAGAQIHIRLRTQDLSGFLPYPAIVDTLLHELCHNELGPHNEQFWQLFCQLKADYLRALLATSASGELYDGRSALTIAQATAEAVDVRSSVLGALARDRQVPVSPIQAMLLDAYLEHSGGAQPSKDVLGRMAGGDGGGGAGASATSPEEMRALLAEKAAERMARNREGENAGSTTTVAEHRGEPAEPLPLPPPPPPLPPGPPSNGSK